MAGRLDHKELKNLFALIGDVHPGIIRYAGDAATRVTVLFLLIQSQGDVSPNHHHVYSPPDFSWPFHLLSLLSSLLMPKKLNAAYYKE